MSGLTQAGKKVILKLVGWLKFGQYEWPIIQQPTLIWGNRMTSEFVRNIHLATAQQLRDQGADLYGILEHFESVFMPQDEVPELLDQLGYPQQDLKQFLHGQL